MVRSVEIAMDTKYGFVIVLLTSYFLREAQEGHEAQRDPPDQHPEAFCAAEPDSAADSKPNSNAFHVAAAPALLVRPIRPNGFLLSVERDRPSMCVTARGETERGNCLLPLLSILCLAPRRPRPLPDTGIAREQAAQ